MPQNSENDNLINRLYPVLDTVDDYSAHGDEYTLETPKIAKDQVELVYAKSNFYIHPTTNTNDHVNGFIAVARNVGAYFLFNSNTRPSHANTAMLPFCSVVFLRAFVSLDSRISHRER